MQPVFFRSICPPGTYSTGESTTCTPVSAFDLHSSNKHPVYKPRGQSSLWFRN